MLEEPCLRGVCACSPSRHLARARLQIKADIKRQAGPAGSVENDPRRTLCMTVRVCRTSTSTATVKRFWISCST